MQLDTTKMLAKIKNSQWALADIDWDAPGRELVTENAELYPKLKVFVADLMWIEHVGARAFAAMAKKAPDDTLVGGSHKYVDVRADAQKTYNEGIQKRLAKTNWNSGCKSWYLSADGFNSTMYPGFATQFARQMADFRERDYRLV